MRFLVFTFLISATAYAQNCGPEVIEHEKKLLKAGEYQGSALLSKMESLIKEMNALSKTRFEGAQKNAMKHCLKHKDQLFQKLMVRPEPSIQENAAFQETVADFYLLHADPQSALIYIDRAVQLNPKSLSLLIKNLQIYSDANDIELREIADKPIAKNEVQRLFEEYIKRSARITDHPDASKTVKIEGLRYQAMVARALKNFTQEMQLLERLLGVEPRNNEAHQRRLEYFLSKGLMADATETMKRLTREKMDSPKNWVQFLEGLFVSEKWEELINWSNKAPTGLLAANPDIKIRIARAYLELSRINDAEKIMREAPKNLKGKSLRLAQQNNSRLKEIEADKLKDEGRLSEALDEYKTALKASPRPLTVKEKISLLIYEYRKGLSFKPQEATQKDLSEVVTLLEDSVYKTELKSNLFGIYLHSAKFIGSQGKLQRGCARFKEVYPELIRGKDYISYCQSAPSAPIKNADDPVVNNRQL